jgi:UDP-N-acetylglucosamine/UDP-N-acetylgalactosamine diphosphorylase
MTASDLQQIRQRYIKAGQDHVFRFWDDLSDDQRSQLLAQLENIDPEKVTEIASRTLNSSPSRNGAADVIEPLPKESSASILDEDPETVIQWTKLGLEAIAENKVAVVLLAGGQGTRLGSIAPKGCYNVGLPSDKSLFQLQAERIIKIAALAAESTTTTTTTTTTRPTTPPVIPWYIMTSGPTKKDTEDLFVQNKYFGLDPSNVVFFEQGVLPCLTREGKIIMDGKFSVAVAPDGNGGIYNALYKSGILFDIKDRGIEHIHTYCVDNSLVKVADPAFIGFAKQRNVDIATKVVRKRDASESVGLIVSKNRAPGVVEYSEISQELASATEENNPSLLKFRAANIVNHYYSASFLLDIPNWKSQYLPFHVAHKRIPFVDLETGAVVKKPTEPNGIKLEQFVFDVFPNLSFDKFASLEVSRQEEFSPLKNGPGAKVDSPETSRRDLLAQSARWLEQVGAVAEAEVEISPLTSYGGEGLEAYKGKHIPAGAVL